jgi:hypothetical protein
VLLLEALLTYLADDVEVVRRASAPGPLPALLTDPKEGVPPPGTGVAAANDAILAALQTGGIPARVREDELRKDIVDIWIRAKTSARARQLEEEAIRPNLIDKTDWNMGGLWIGESLQWRPLQRFSSDSDGFTFITAYIFERRAT